MAFSLLCMVLIINVNFLEFRRNFWKFYWWKIQENRVNFYEFLLKEFCGIFKNTFNKFIVSDHTVRIYWIYGRKRISHTEAKARKIKNSDIAKTSKNDEKEPIFCFYAIFMVFLLHVRFIFCASLGRKISTIYLQRVFFPFSNFFLFGIVVTTSAIRRK